MRQNNTSGEGKGALVPEELKGWNWGAFFLTWIWGIGNSTYIALLMFIPLVNMILPFVLGAKGNEWAWKNRSWRSVEHFQATQRKWRNVSFVIFLVVVPLLFVGIMSMAMSMLKGEAYDLSVREVKSDQYVLQIVGNNPKPSYFVSGQVSSNGSEGSANLSYSLKGDLGEVDIFVLAHQLNNKWKLDEVLAIENSTNKEIIVVTKPIE